MSSPTSAALASPAKALKGLSKRQLAVVTWLAANPRYLVDMRDSRIYPEPRFSISDKQEGEDYELERSFRKALGLTSYASTGHIQKQVLTKLRDLGMLVEIAEVQHEGTTGRRYQPRVARYALANTVKEAAGYASEVLSDLMLRERERIARDDAYMAALAPFNKRASEINGHLRALQGQWKGLIMGPIEQVEQVRREYGTMLQALENLNEAVAKVCVEHGKKPVIYERW